MPYKIDGATELFLSETRVENIFISEYMPSAPADYVKVYLYGIMYAEFNMDISDEKMAQQLGLTPKDVKNAWDYWVSMGAARRTKTNQQNDTIEFITLRQLMYGTQTAAGAEAAAEEAAEQENEMADQSLKLLFQDAETKLGRTLSSKELENMISWVKEEKIPPAIISYCIEYCANLGKTSMRYVSAVLHNWYERGITSREQAEKYLQETDERHAQYKTIMNELGFRRNPTEKEKQMMDSWFDEMGYRIDQVLEACRRTSGISNPNFNYVNKILTNWKDTAEKKGTDVQTSRAVTQSTLSRYYDWLRRKEEGEAEERTKEVYQKVPHIREIDDHIRELSSKLSRTLLLGHDEQKNRSVKQQIDRLNEERAVVLTENNYPMDYTDVHYLCEKCSDTGLTDLGQRCTCTAQRMEEAAIWQKTNQM